MSIKLVRLLMIAGIAAGIMSAIFWQKSTEKYRTLDYKKEISILARLFSALGSRSGYSESINRYIHDDPVQVHDIFHWVGNKIYQQEGIGGFAICTDAFNWGCYHGFLGTAFIKEGNAFLPSAEKICLDAISGKHVLNGCLHGIGHGILSMAGGYEYSHLTIALSNCDLLAASTSQNACYNGVFMEFNMRTMVAVPAGATALRAFDAQKQFFPCDQLPEKYTQDCYYEQTDWWRIVLDRDFMRMGALCDTLPSASKARYGCFRGIGRGMWGESKFTREKALENCKRLTARDGVTACVEVIDEELVAGVGKRMMQSVEKESDDDKQLDLIASLTRQVGPEKAIALLNDSSFAKAGKSHLLAHKIGEIAFDMYKEDALPYCREDMRSGCSHGLFTAAIAHVGFGGVERMIEKCKSWSKFQYTMCLHAAGHAFTALGGYDVFAAVAQCDKLTGPTQEERNRCYSGVFMENAHGVHGGLIPPMHPWLSVSDLLKPCNIVDLKYRTACYYNQAGWWYADVFDRDLGKTIAVCATVPGEYQSACYDNVARVISTQENNDIEKVKSACALLPNSWKDECFKSIAISAYSQGDETLPFIFCRIIVSGNVKKSCYQRLESDFLLHEVTKETYWRLCAEFEAPYKTLCGRAQ